jgi:rhamnose utilization protein RhaD (predicted bifunctional aldolase and dehydrogenase)/NAD(P)-dependent dehydrogenase (short-subunit alcohol dehydrogenase family)
MQSLWTDTAAVACYTDPLRLRVYSSRLLGQEPDLVLHGGGNTSVKATIPDFFGDPVDVLYVKGSGWDLGTIEAPGFAPVRMDALLKLAELPALSDAEMVTQQRAAMLDPKAPNPSVEAILHALIPFTFVDHTHADAVVTVTNSPDGEARIREIYGDRVIIIPYVMPGFILAKTVREHTEGIDWSAYDGMILMNHGVFTFADSAKAAYESMIGLVSEAEAYLDAKSARSYASADGSADGSADLLALAEIRQQVSDQRGSAMLASLDDSPAAVGFANLAGVADFATRGPVTPDHVIRTKRAPVILDRPEALAEFAGDYTAYFQRLSDGQLTMLDVAPRWGVWPGHGTLAFGRSSKETGVIGDIIAHTRQCIQAAEALGGWTALDEASIFEVEYWELEQAKLAKAGPPPEFQGQIALVTGGGSGIGRACARRLHDLGASVVVLDRAPQTDDPWLSITGDVADSAALREAVETAVARFGGLDILVLNAGIFPEGQSIDSIDETLWEQTLAINLTSQQRLLAAAIPYLKLGVRPAVVVIGSRNVPAPGVGAAAYSASKAALTQVARIAALELAPFGIRVNIVHPDCVYDTGIWADGQLEARAANYGMTVAEYKARNLLGSAVSSDEVAALVATMAGPVFGKTTGAQVPIDAGSNRVV